MALPKDIDARRYCRAAFQRLDEAEQILTKIGLPAAAIYLAGYSVECILKALMIERTIPTSRSQLLDELKKDFGHNLHRLREGLASRGVRVPSMENRCLLNLSVWSPNLRYEPGPGRIKDAERFLREARKLIGWADRSM
jgi:HEPN domain-containing protein